MSRSAQHRHAPDPRSSRSTIGDETLVAWAVAGDQAAFGDLVLRHQRGLVNYLFRLTGNRDTAMDLAQDVFVKVYQSLASFDPTYRFTTWLYRIASNGAIDHRRRREPRAVAITEDRDDGSACPGRRLVAADPSPHDVARLRELERRLDEAVGELPPSYRQLILLRHRGQHRYDEIARITKLPIGTVKNRIFRAREILRARLADVLDREV